MIYKRMTDRLRDHRIDKPYKERLMNDVRLQD